MKGTTPKGATSAAWISGRQRRSGRGPATTPLTDYNYAAETYDAVIIIALATAQAGTDGIGPCPSEIDGITGDGEKCTTFADCLALIEAGTRHRLRRHVRPASSSTATASPLKAQLRRC